VFPLLAHVEARMTPTRTDYREHFHVADLIHFRNRDLPTWATGMWRVESVTPTEVWLQPEGEPANRFQCSIVEGGLLENVCRWPERLAKETIQ
jgi:hypothetical protein